MNLLDVQKILQAEVLVGAERLATTEVISGCGSDLMSDVLAFTKKKTLLLTGLINPQVIRTAEIAELEGIVFVRGKRPSLEVIELAKSKNLALLFTTYPLFESCGLLFAAGLEGCRFGKEEPVSLMERSFVVSGGDFALAGEGASKIKKILTQLGLGSELIRKVAVAAYEAEMNIVIHAYQGELKLYIDQDAVKVIATDRGPGIKNIELAMQEGFSTASEEARQLGFGAGMGLPNMKRCSERFEINSVIGQGTVVTMHFKPAKS